MVDIAVHPIADLFPLPNKAQLELLAGSILLHGLTEPIKLYQKKILTGRDIYLACKMAKVDPVFEEFAGDDPYSYGVRKNLAENPYTNSQRALMAARLVALSNDGIIDGSAIAQPQAGKLFEVGVEQVSRAAQILDAGTEDEIKAVANGTLAIHGLVELVRKRRGKKAPKGRRRGGDQKTIEEQNRDNIRKNNMKLWKQLRLALESFNHMPKPADMIPVVNAVGRSHFVLANVTPVIEWLIEFNSALENGKRG